MGELVQLQDNIRRRFHDDSMELLIKKTEPHVWGTLRAFPTINPLDKQGVYNDVYREYWEKVTDGRIYFTTDEVIEKHLRIQTWRRAMDVVNAYRRQTRFAKAVTFKGLASAEDSYAIREAVESLDRLGQMDREVLKARADGKSYAEIDETMETGNGAARRRVFRIREELKRYE